MRMLWVWPETMGSPRLTGGYLRIVDRSFHKNLEFMVLESGPGFIPGQRGGHNDGDLVAGRRLGGEIHLHIVIRQMGARKRVPALYIEQTG